MKYKYTFETEFDVDVCYRKENRINCISHEPCPFLSFRDMRCENEGVVLNCECALVPWTGKKRTPKFEIPVNTKWERCPLSRKRKVEPKAEGSA